MTNGDPEDGYFYPTLTRIMDSFSFSPLHFFFIYLFICLFQNKLPDAISHGDVGKIAWVRKEFLSNGKISDIPIQCARKLHVFMFHHEYQTNQVSSQSTIPHNFRGYRYSKILFGEVYRKEYSRKFSLRQRAILR